MAEFERNRSNLMAHYQLQFKDSGGRERWGRQEEDEVFSCFECRVLKVLDCNGNKRAQHLVREWFARSRWVSRGRCGMVLIVLMLYRLFVFMT